MQLLELESDSYDLPSFDTDPTTKCKYSLPYDSALYLVENKCSCGNAYELPNLIPAKLSLPPFDPEEKIIILGFMGAITEDSASLTKITDENRKNIENTIKVGRITKSEGIINRYGDLYCISNPSVFGFSGGPVCSFTSDRELKI